MGAVGGALPEVGDHADAIRVEEHVVGFHVAVEDTLSGNGFVRSLLSPVNDTHP